MEILRVKSKKRAVANLLIMLGLCVFTILCFKTKPIYDSTYLGIISLSYIIFLDLLKNSQVAGRKDKDLIINTIIYGFIFIIVYQLILIIYKIDFQIVIKFLCIQILLLILQFERYFIDRIGDNENMISYLLIGTFIVASINKIRKGSSFLDIMLLALAALVLVSLIYSIIVFVHNKGKSKL